MNRSIAAHADLRFLIRAAVLMALLYGAYYYPYGPDSWVTHAIDVYLHGLTRASFGVISLFDGTASMNETHVSGRFALQVVKSCSSLDAQGLYVAAVLALSTSVWKKALGLAIGIAALNVLNVFRIAGLYFVGAYAPLSFDAVHEEILPFVLVICACGLFAVWTRWSLAGAPAAADAGARP